MMIQNMVICLAPLKTHLLVKFKNHKKRARAYLESKKDQLDQPLTDYLARDFNGTPNTACIGHY